MASMRQPIRLRCERLRHKTLWWLSRLCAQRLKYTEGSGRMPTPSSWVFRNLSGLTKSHDRSRHPTREDRQVAVALSALPVLAQPARPPKQPMPLANQALGAA